MYSGSLAHLLQSPIELEEKKGEGKPGPTVCVITRSKTARRPSEVREGDSDVSEGSYSV